MTGVIAIDESGDLGKNGSRYFSMAAIIMLRSRYLKTVAKMIPNDGKEHKWSNSSDGFRKKIFEELSKCEVSIAYIVVDKQSQEYGGLCGNELYRKVLRELLSESMKKLPCKDVNVMIDRCRFIALENLRQMCDEESKILGVNVKKCEKVTSEQNRCIQIVDYIAGAARELEENGKTEIKILKEKISVARKY